MAGMLGLDPLSEYTTDWATSSDWANSAQSLDGYSWAGVDRVGRYGPAYSYYDNQYFGPKGSGYDPTGSFTSSDISGAFNRHFQQGGMYYDLTQFSQQVNSGAGGTAGDIARDPSFGQFAATPGSWDKMQAAATKAGIPSNVLQTFVAMESSGDWARDGNRLWNGRPSMGGLLPYIGVFDLTLKSRLGITAESLLGNQQGQLDAAAQILAQMYGEAKSANPSYGWGNVASYYFSGYFDPVANPWGDEHGNYGGNAGYMNTFLENLNRLDQWTQANGGKVGTSGSGAVGLGSVNTPAWQGVNKWDTYIAEAAQTYGVPPNLIKAVMRLESGGEPGSVSKGAGAIGLMQVMPNMHGLSAQQLLDPRTNVLKGAEILKNNFNQWGSWELATKAYLAGNPYSAARDSYGTGVEDYWQRVNGYLGELDASVSGLFNGPEGEQGPTTTLDAIWYGTPGVYVTQGNLEVNEWVLDNTSVALGGRYTGGRGMYDYAVIQFGQMGHPGVDYGMPTGSKLFSPVGGTVVNAGGTGYYIDVNSGNAPGTGELKIRLDNGHEIILGHMSGIFVQPGQRVSPGEYVGISGTYGSGQHLHLEYRAPDSSKPGGWASISPDKALAGVFTGSISGNTSAPGAAGFVPLTFHDVLRRSASGGDISLYGKNFSSSGSSWRDWLGRTFMQSLSGTGGGYTPQKTATTSGIITPRV